jgi:hypothetical protein
MRVLAFHRLPSCRQSPAGTYTLCPPISPLKPAGTLSLPYCPRARSLHSPPWGPCSSPCLSSSLLHSNVYISNTPATLRSLSPNSCSIVLRQFLHCHSAAGNYLWGLAFASGDGSGNYVGVEAVDGLGLLLPMVAIAVLGLAILGLGVRAYIRLEAITHLTAGGSHEFGMSHV